MCVFTASQSSYAHTIINQIDPGNKYFRLVLTREHCVKAKNGSLVKDLRIVEGVRLEDVLIVDNCCPNFINQWKNGIPIIPFYDNYDDDELVKLGRY